jgi:hypothetical protein
VLRGGDFALCVHNKREWLRVTRQGDVRAAFTLPFSPAGIVAYGDGALVVGGDPGQGPHRLYELDASGRVSERLTIPDTLFLNGFTPGLNGKAYAVDSILGAIFEIDLAHWTSRVVAEDERLSKISDEPMLPGANGIKLGDGALFITNTDRATVLKASLSDAGVAALEVIAEGLRGDDLAIDDQGRLYITNHIHNTLIRVNPDGSERVAIAGPDQGMPGCTACAFHPDDPGALYVTTTGGMVMPLTGIVQEAKLVRLEVGAVGRPLPELA